MAKGKVRAPGALPAAVLALLPFLLLVLERLICLQRPAALLSSGGRGGEYLLLLCPALLFWALLGRLWAIWLAEGIPLLLLALVSHYKQLINGTPLELGDLSLLSGAGEILGFALPQARLTLPTVLCLGGYLLILGLLIAFGRFLRPGRALRLGVLGCGAALGLVLGVLRPVPANTRGCGPALRLYTAWAEDLARPEGRTADPAVLEAIRARVETAEAPRPARVPAEGKSEEATEPTFPTVIFLMSESFFDVTELPGLHFRTDPLENFHALAREGRTGPFLSPTYCGGTGYVEMEVLTGLCSGLLHGGDTLTSLPEERYRGLPCITDVFAAQGYCCGFVHSYNEKLYNRAVIYDAFGFDRRLFADDFPPDAQHAGGFLSDMALTGQILTLLEEGGGRRQMIFSVSMENHQPYYAGKYPEEAECGLSSPLLDGEELAVLNCYVHGLEDADRALGALVKALKAREEPVMLVFWGDHRPNLGLPDGRSVYADLGCCPGSDTEAWGPDELKSMLSTDYLIWTNYAPPGEGRTESSTLLGLHVLEELGFPLTDWFRWLRLELDGNCLLYRPRLFVEGTGEARDAVPPEQRERMRAFAAAVSDMVYGDNALFRRHRGER